MMINIQGKIKSWQDIKDEGANIQWLIYNQFLSRLKEIMSMEGGILRNETEFEQLIINQKEHIL